jgi:hypothetical protein
LSPIFRLFELPKRVLRYKLPRAEISQHGLIVVTRRGGSLARGVVAFLLA